MSRSVTDTYYPVKNVRCVLLANSDSHPSETGREMPCATVCHTCTHSASRKMNMHTHHLGVNHISISVIWFLEGNGHKDMILVSPLKGQIFQSMTCLQCAPLHLSQMVGITAFGAALLTTNPAPDDAIRGQAVARKPNFNPKTLNHSLRQEILWKLLYQLRQS